MLLSLKINAKKTLLETMKEINGYRLFYVGIIRYPKIYKYIYIYLTFVKASFVSI